LGCSADDEEGGTCAEQTGSYLGTFTTRSGNCGPQAESIMDLSGNGGGGGDPACNSRFTRSADGCHVDMSYEYCPMEGTAFTTSGTWSIDWSRDGATASGVAAISVYDGSILECTGSYDVAFRRL
jgi:hypothetical protein